MRFSKCFTVLATASVLIAGFLAEVNLARPRSDAERERLIQSARRPAPRPEYHILYSQSVVDDRSFATGSTETAASFAVSANPPPASPGLEIAKTYYDRQQLHSMGYQIGRIPGADVVHMLWMDALGSPLGDHDRDVYFNQYRISTNALLLGYGGDQIGFTPPARASAGNIAVGTNNYARVVLNERDGYDIPYHTWHLWIDAIGYSGHVDDDLLSASACPETNWPKIALRRRPGGADISHVVSRDGFGCSSNYVVYWRLYGGNWQGPAVIDSSGTAGHAVVVDQNSDKVAIVLHTDHELQLAGANNVAYYESATTGLGWLSGSELGSSFKTLITNYSDTADGPQAFVHIAAAYDNAGTLHVVWDEQRLANKTADVAIRHWNDLRGTIRTATLGHWPSTQNLGANNLNLSKMTLGVGNGGTSCQGGAVNNLDYLYVLYTQFGGLSQAEQNDVSASGYYNGELYLTASTDGGASWSAPQNLTNTTTPGCNPQVADSVCRSEHWASIGQAVSDIDIVYVSDLDAGAALQGEGSWQQNPVMYLHIPGGTTDAEFLCPALAPNLAVEVSSDPECEYHADPGEIHSGETISISNLGNAPLFGEISVVGASWLSVAGAGPFTISPDGPEPILPITMDATSLTEGLYTGVIRITHNDTSRPSPYDITIEFFVIADFSCTQRAVLSTGVE